MIKRNRLTDIVFVACSVLLTGLICLNVIKTSLQKSGPDTPYSKGKVVKPVTAKALGLSRSYKSLILVTRSSCHFCTQSMPFFRQLADVARKSKVPLLAVSSETPEDNLAYLRQNGVIADDAVPLEASQLGVNGTPTVILIRKDGLVINSWIGMISAPDRQREILEAVN